MGTYNVIEDLLVHGGEASGSWSHLSWVTFGYAKKKDKIRMSVINLPDGEMMVRLATMITGLSSYWQSRRSCTKTLVLIYLVTIKYTIMI